MLAVFCFIRGYEARKREHLLKNGVITSTQYSFQEGNYKNCLLDSSLISFLHEQLRSDTCLCFCDTLPEDSPQSDSHTLVLQEIFNQHPFHYKLKTIDQMRSVTQHET